MGWFQRLFRRGRPHEKNVVNHTRKKTTYRRKTKRSRIKPRIDYHRKKVVGLRLTPQVWLEYRLLCDKYGIAPSHLVEMHMREDLKRMFFKRYIEKIKVSV